MSFRNLSSSCRSSSPDMFFISHSQRISSITVVLKGDEAVITALSGEDLTLEKGTLEAGGNSLFEEVFNLKPVLRQKKPVNAR